jgi:alpha-1,6-mannosyltransferase
VDSFFWRRLLWPEGQVLFFNTVLNRSHEWGVAPWHWYLTNALPRGLTVSAPLFLLSMLRRGWERALLRGALREVVDADVAQVGAPALAFVVLYSFLPHKELRFLLPAFPAITICAAHGAHKLLVSAVRSRVARVACALLSAGWIASLWLTAAGVWGSAHNYPGGEALLWMHEHEGRLPAHCAAEPDRSECWRHVHICVRAAMTGVSRFLERPDLGWTYSKNETAQSDAEMATRFSHVITDEPDRLARYFDVMHEQHGFARFELRSVPPFATQWALTVMRNKRV